MHDLLMSNLFAQCGVLAFGRTDAELRAAGITAVLAPHKLIPGNRPSNTILAPALTPACSVSSRALQTHSLVQGIVWNINALSVAFAPAPAPVSSS